MDGEMAYAKATSTLKGTTGRGREIERKNSRIEKIRLSTKDTASSTAWRVIKEFLFSIES